MKAVWHKVLVFFGFKINYKDSYNAITEANYLQSQVMQSCYKPKYRRLKNFVVSLTIYLLFISLAYNIMLVRELANTREHLSFILGKLQKINELEYSTLKNGVKAMQEHKKHKGK